MKAIERQLPGYSAEGLAGFLERTLFSAFFDQPVRGVCFAAGPESLSLARDFAGAHLALGTIVLHLEPMAPEELHTLAQSFLPPQAEFSRVAFILPHLDLAAPDLQTRIAATVSATPGALWFPIVSDHRRLIPALQLLSVIYLGLSPHEQMRFLAVSGQFLSIDEGSLQRAPRPES